MGEQPVAGGKSFWGNEEVVVVDVEIGEDYVAGYRVSLWMVVERNTTADIQYGNYNGLKLYYRAINLSLAINQDTSRCRSAMAYEPVPRARFP